MPINRSPLQQSVHDIGTHLRRIANTPDWSDDALCPTDTGDHGVVVTGDCDTPAGLFFDGGCRYHIGAKIEADHPVWRDIDTPPPHDPRQDDRPLARDITWSPNAVDGGVLGTVKGARKYYPSTNDDLLPAHRRSWISGATPQSLNDAGTTISKSAFLELLPHSPTARMRYVAKATDGTPKWECLDYAKTFWAWMIAVGIYPTGFVLDFQGGHSYNTVLVYDEGISAYEVLVIEPQGNIIVPRAYPEHHYTGTGVVMYY